MTKVIRGQKVWVWMYHSTAKVQEATVKSVGRKYITLEGINMKFNSETLREVGGVGYGSFIILDIDEYNENQKYLKYRRTLSRFDWEKMSREDTDKVIEVINKY